MGGNGGMFTFSSSYEVMKVNTARVILSYFAPLHCCLVITDFLIFTIPLWVEVSSVGLTAVTGSNNRQNE